MWYYKKDGNIIGPASARKIVSMRELGIITDSTPVSRKRNAKKLGNLWRFVGKDKS